MDSDYVNVFLNSTVLIGIFAGAVFLILMYILKLFKTEDKLNEHYCKTDEKSVHQYSEKKKEHSTGSSKSKKKSAESKWSSRADKQGFTHPWLIKSLKGHTGEVLDMDFSSNNKYLASCGDEDPDPGGDIESSSSSDCNKENSRPPSTELSPRTKGLSRRQRKNRRREDASPDTKKKSKARKPEQPLQLTKKTLVTPLKQYIKLNNRAVFLWDLRDITHGDHKSVRVNIDFDYPIFVKWSPDSKAFIIQRYSQNSIEVYKVEKKKDGWLGQPTKASTFQKSHEEDVIGMSISSNGKFIISCSSKTDLVVWDLKGNILAHVDTYLMNTTCAKISPCGRFIVASGFAPDAKVWEAIFTKNGDFQEIKRVFELTGHSSGVYDIAFDVDSSHMATVSKDGTWKLFDTNIEYKKGEDPHLKITAKYDMSGNHALIALSPNSEVVVIATSNSLAFYTTNNGKLDQNIENIYNAKITSLKFDATGKYLLTTGDKQIRIFRNITGLKRDIEIIEEKLKQPQTAATKERLLQQKTDALREYAALKKK